MPPGPNFLLATAETWDHRPHAMGVEFELQRQLHGLSLTRVIPALVGYWKPRLRWHLLFLSQWISASVWFGSAILRTPKGMARTLPTVSPPQPRSQNAQELCT